MQSFTEAFSIFLMELKYNILNEISESNTTYVKLKSENDQLLTQLQSSIPSVLLDSYIETQYAIATLEINYCYLCGIRDRNTHEIVNPTGDSIAQELCKIDKYKRWQDQITMQYNELLAIIAPEYCLMLIQYVKKWNTITELERHYCYIGGISDKAKLDEILDFKSENAWENFIGLFM